MLGVKSLAELDAASEHSAYYYDGEWVHVKLVGEFDVTVGGVMEDERGEIVEYEPRLVFNDNLLFHFVRFVFRFKTTFSN